MASENRIKIICSVETIRFYKNEFGIAVVSVDKVKEGKPKTDKFNQIIIKGTMPHCPRFLQQKKKPGVLPPPRFLLRDG